MSRMDNGRFKKGHKTWNKGKKGLTGANSGSFKKGQASWSKGTVGICKPNVTSFKEGIHYSRETEFKKGMQTWNKGKKASDLIRKKLSLAHMGKMRGAENPNWKGGRFIDKRGYVQLSINGRKFYEHRIVMERIIERPLKRSETVHHKNHNKSDNRIENLELLSASSHGKLHTPKGSKVGVHIKKTELNPCCPKSG